MALQAPVPTPVGRPSRVRYWVIVFAVTLAVVTYIDRVSISFAEIDIRHDLGLTKLEMGAVFSAFGWAYALFEMPGGWLGDWMGPRKVLTRIVLWWSFFTAATGWAWNLTSLTITRFLFGAGEAGCFPNLTKSFTTWLPRRERVRAQGFMWLSARWGGALTPPLVAAVMASVGWRHSFEIFGCLGVIWGVIFYFWYRDDPLKKAGLNAAERELLAESSKMAAGHGDVPWGKLVRSRSVWMLCWQYFCLSYGWYFYITWLPTYLREGRHLQISSSKWLAMMPLLCGGLGNPVSVIIGARLVRRNGSVAKSRRIMASVGFVGAAAFLTMSTRIQDATLAMVFIGIASFCNDLVMPAAWGSAMDIGGKYAGTLSGAMNMWGNIGGAIAPTAIAFILKWTGEDWNMTFYVSAVIYLFGVVCWALLDPVTPVEAEA